MEGGNIYPVTKAVMGFQLRRVFVGEETCLLQVCTDNLAIALNFLLSPAATVKVKILLHGDIRGIQIPVFQKRGLVENRMSLVNGGYI